MKTNTYFFKGPITACVSFQRASRNYVVIGKFLVITSFTGSSITDGLAFFGIHLSEIFTNIFDRYNKKK